MRRMATLMVLATAVLLVCTPAGARQAREVPLTEVSRARPDTVFWFDDMESGEVGWTHGDNTATVVTRFHRDTYMAYYAGESWWCGCFDYDADGGYGNGWDQRLDLPPVDLSAATYPVLFFYYRNDTEAGYDYSYVQAESLGAYVDLNRGYDGVHAWAQTGIYVGGHDLAPANIRFRVVSDGAWSDEDGEYASVGGAFACDNIEIIDYTTGMPLLYADYEAGDEGQGFADPVPSLPSSAGDYWHLIENNCKAFSDPHVWVNMNPDTLDAFVPPGVDNWLMTPMVDISSAVTCTTYFVIQFFTPDPAEGYWTEEVGIDGTWTQLHAWYGDQCASGHGPCDHFGGIQDDITALLPGSLAAHRWTYHSGDNGVVANTCACAGITLDDIGFFGDEEPNPVEDRSWGSIKSMYR